MTLATEVFSGKNGGPWAVRAKQVRVLMTTLFGADGPTVPALGALGAGSRRTPPLRASAALRGPAEASARAVLEALLARNFPRLETRLDATVWVLWPDGTLARHERKPLIVALSRREGKAVHSRPDLFRTYPPGELRSVLARGLPEALDALLMARAGFTVGATVKVPKGPLLRLTMVMSLGLDGRWRARNLPLAGVDLAHLRSAHANTDDDQALRIADRAIRHILLGQPSQIRSLRNWVTDRVWLGKDVVEAERLPSIAAGGSSNLSQADTVFLGTRSEDLSSLDQRAGAGVLDRMKRASVEVYRRPWIQLAPRLAVTTLATLDAQTQAICDEREVVTVLVRGIDPVTDLERPLIAALFLEPP